MLEHHSVAGSRRVWRSAGLAKEAHHTREPEAALDRQNRFGNAAYLVTAKYGIPGLKYAMDLAGYYVGPPRLPLIIPTPEAKKEIDKAFADLRG